MGNSSIFKQLIVKVILPVVVALLALAVINVQRTKDILVQSSVDKNKILADEIQTILEFQDEELALIESKLDSKIKEYSSELVNDIFINTKGIEKANLDSIRAMLSMNPSLYDIYVINSSGVVVNTTFPKDLNLNTFQAFGDSFKEFIYGVLRRKTFEGNNFSPEGNSNKLRKYSYHATHDGKFVIELGVYSEDADNVIKKVVNKLNNISRTNDNIEAVDLFIGGADKAFSFNNRASTIDSSHMKIYQEVLAFKNSVLEDENSEDGYTDTRTLEEIVDGRKFNYQFTYMPRRNTNIYKDSVIRIVSDRTKEQEVINKELFTFLSIFGLTIFTLFLVILYAAKSVTRPLNKLVESVNIISRGNLNERAKVRGSKEIVKLTFHFNEMISRLEEFYNDLEQKVIERTAEISQQKEEIEAQRDQIEAQRDKLVGNNRNLEVAYKRIEAQAQRITDSIHYARRIQHAILPSSSQLASNIKDHFVLFRPKDIVSGDFYWSSRKDGKSVIVVADCTGHGVPGAFMSMIGNTLLNKIVNENAITQPDLVLNNLRDEIIGSLKQKGGINESKDGMDIVICSIDYVNKKMEFAGANNPLFLIRDQELQVIKGDKMPVGYFINDMPSFTSHQIDLLAGDRIYLFTDGYQDQFGGENDRKFMVKRFKRLLLEEHLKPMEDQREILNQTISDWMLNTKQVDDILVIGLKV